MIDTYTLLYGLFIVAVTAHISIHYMRYYGVSLVAFGIPFNLLLSLVIDGGTGATHIGWEVVQLMSKLSEEIASCWRLFNP